MNRNFRKALIVLLSTVFVSCIVALAGCSSCNDKDSKTDSYTGLFAGDSHDYVLTSDYTLTEDDVKNTDGKDNVTLGYVCTFDLGGHVLDLGGYTLNITTDSNKVVSFKNGRIKNGYVNISIPNGDINFDAATMEKTVTYELEAASETITFSNAIVLGNCTVKSNTHINVVYSSVSDITLAGNGTLNAGNGALLGAVTVSEQASGAKVRVADAASVDQIELKASANVTVAGSVSAVKVSEKVQSNSSNLSIKVAQGAAVASVELNAPASVEVSGTISNIVVKKTAGEANIALKETASVTTIAVDAEKVTVESNGGYLTQLVVADSVSDITNNSGVQATVVSEDEMNEYTAHQHVMLVTRRENATCTETGKLYYACDCGITSEEIIPSLGHSFNTSVLREPTDDENGEMLYKCVRCGHEETRTIFRTASIVLNGVETLFTAIPDGTYTFAVDKNNPIKFIMEGEVELNVNDAALVVTVDGGKLRGTLDGTVNVDTENDQVKVDFRAKIDNNVIYAYYSGVESKYGQTIDAEAGILETVSGAIKMGLAQLLPFDIDELDLLSYIDKINFDSLKDVQISLDAVDKLAVVLDSAIVKTTENGNTTYTFDSDKLAESLTKLGDKKVNVLVDEVLGEGAFDALCEICDGVSDELMITFALELYSFSEKFNISEQDILSLADAIFQAIAPKDISQEITATELITEYYNLNFATVITIVMGKEPTEANVAETKNLIEDSIKEYIGYADLTVAELVDKLTGAEAAGDSEEAISYASIIDMVSAYSEPVTIWFTFDADNKLSAFTVSYEENGIKVNLTKTAESNVPVIDVVINFEHFGLTVKSEEIENGEKIIVNVAGAEAVLTTVIKDNGADVNFTLKPDKDDDYELRLSLDADIALTVNKDADGNITGGYISAEGEFEETYYGEKGTVSGGITVSVNNGSGINQSVWDSFEGDTDMYYHMDVTFATYGSNNSAVRLQYVSEGNYYLLTETSYNNKLGYIEERVYTSKLLSIKGLPEVMLMYEGDCTDWLELHIEYGAIAEYTYKEIIGGKLVVKNGIRTVEGGMVDEDSIESYTSNNWYSGYCYYNLTTGEVAYESAHNLKYASEFLTDSNRCEDGIRVTVSCTTCNKTLRVSTMYGHYYMPVDKTVLDTQCGSSLYLEETECIACHEKQLSVNYHDGSVYNEHNFDHFDKQVLSAEEYNRYLTEYGMSAEEVESRYINVQSLKDYGIVTTAYHYSSATVIHCARCGLNIYEFRYYTNTQKDGCLEHTAYVISYKGNSDYKAFEYSKEVTKEGHYAPYGEGVERSLNTAVNEAKAIIGNLPFTATEAKVTEYKCAGCGAVIERRYEFRNNVANLTLYVYYADGQVTDWNYYGRSSDLQTALKEAEKLGQSLNGATDGRVEYYGNYSKSTEVDVRLNSATSSLTIDADIYSHGGGHMNVNYNYFTECRCLAKYYNYVDGSWVLSDTNEYKQHTYQSKDYYGNNCCEDGYYSQFGGCIYCGEGRDGVLNYNHPHTFIGRYDINVQEYANYLASETGLGGLNAKLSFNSGCYNCETLVGVTISLTGNWTLTNDVYIKAQGITLDLNGCTIDLNGHNLVIYSYDGNKITITDAAFDSSVLENIGPEDDINALYNSKICNNADNAGALVAATNHGDIEIGNIALLLEENGILLSDTDDLYSMYDSFAQHLGNAGYLQAERPAYKDFINK